jgi:hypothetical protein
VVRARVTVVLSVAAVLAATITFSVGGAGSRTAARAATSPGITFSAPAVVDTVHTLGEPDVKVDPSNTSRFYVSGPWGTGTQRSIWNFSEDGGRTFHPMHDTPLTSANQSDTQHTGPGGGDTEISIDHTGKVYYADLAALVSLKFATWDPSTRTLQTSFYAENTDQGANGVDRQWFGLWDPPAAQASSVRAATGYTGPFPVNYLDYAEALAGCCQAAGWSTDGLNYHGPTVEYTVGDDGPVVVDQQTGTVIQAIGYDGNTDQVGVAILTRAPTQPGSDPALRVAHEVKIADLPAGATVDALFPVIAIDKARNVYVAWVTRSDSSTSQDPNAWQIFYSYATAASGWQTWSAPRQISSAPAVTNVMPWAVAGSAGRLAVVWYGTPDGAHQPSTEDNHQAWNVYLATISNAASATPTVTQVKATPHPMHYGTVCLEGLNCITIQGNRNLADFFEVGVDPKTGGIQIVYDDTSNELVQRIPQGPGVPPPIDGSADHRGAPVVTLLRQNGGIGLFGTSVSGRKASATSMNDASGDAHFDPIYSPASNIPQLDLLGADVASSGSDVVFRLSAKDLHNLASAVSATGGQAVDYVFRWSGRPVADPTTGTRIPIYYAAVEVDGSGTPTYFAGTAVSYELCSVSGCFPHITDYPAPPDGGTAVTGKVTLTSPNRFVIRVPRSVIGNPADGSTLESLGVYTYARNRSASSPITNAEAQGGVTPIAIDGVCCVNPVLGPRK